LRRRIAVRMRAKHSATAGEYATALDNDPREYDRLIRSLTVNVTKFFRNWDTYSMIADKIIPELWERGDWETRVWSAGCSDIDTGCLAAAERAVYADSALGDTPPALRAHYFPDVAGLHTMLPEVRRLVSFECNDLLAYEPRSEDTHLILCRNVIIYFEREAQDALFSAFHRALAPGGFLVLGKVESLLGDARALFSPVNARERIFRKI